MNWIKEMNIIDKDIASYVYDMCIDVYTDLEKELFQYNDKFNNLINTSIKLNNENKHKELMKYISEEYEDVINIYRNDIEIIFHKYIKQYRANLEEIYETKLQSMKYIFSAINQKQRNLFFKRLGLIFKGYESKLFYFLEDIHNSFQENIVFICNIFKDYAISIINMLKESPNWNEFITDNPVYIDKTLIKVETCTLSSHNVNKSIHNLKMLSKIVEKYDNEYLSINVVSMNDIINEKEKNGIKYEKIFNYKELNKLATSNLFEYKYSNGSHQIFENKNTKKIVVIPAHEIGKGLSIKIQKQICCNS